MAIQAMGVGSGLDIRGLVDQLVRAERAPMQNRIDRQDKQIKAEVSAFGTLKSALSKFQEAVKKLSDSAAFQAMKATSGDDSRVGVSAAPGAETGVFDIEVTQLAQAQSVASIGYSAPLGPGTLTFTVGDLQHEVDLSGAEGTLAEIRDAVNAKSIGVRASIVNDGATQRLVFNATETGTAGAFTIEGTGGLEGLSFGPEATESDMSETRAAEDARFRVNGLELTRSGNQIDDVIEGVTFELKQTGAPVRLEISDDKEKVKENIRAFVDAYNEYQNQVNRLTRFDAATSTAGPLSGDAAVRNISSGLRNLMGQTVAGLEGQALRSLADLGIRTRANGTLEINQATLDKAVDEQFDLVGKVFQPPQGLMADLDSRLKQILENDGLIDSRTKGLNSRLRQLDDQRMRLDMRMEQVEARFVRQFTAMDALVAEMNSTSSFLQQQLANLPGAKRK